MNQLIKNLRLKIFKLCLTQYGIIFSIQYYLTNRTYNIYLNRRFLMEALNTFSGFITEVKSQLNYKQILQNYETIHNLKKYKITEILADNSLEIFQQIVEKFYKNHEAGQSSTWVQNQLKLFLWTVICYLELYGKSLQDMKQSDWDFFAKIFYVKEYNLFEYQARTLLDQGVKSAKWKDNEDVLLYNIIVSDPEAKWNEIAKILYMNSNKQYLRTSKQCRQRWLNHLDPTKSKSQWQIREYLTLFQQVQLKGKKWALIVKMLDDRRSQHTIKNKYNSIIKKKIKMSPQLNQQQAIQQIIRRINNIIEFYHIDPNDQYLFGCTSKILSSQNRYAKKMKKNSRLNQYQRQGCLNRIQNFRHKIQQFASDQTKQPIKTQTKKKQPKKLNFDSERKNEYKCGSTKKGQSQKKQQQKFVQDQIFYEQSFQVNDLLKPHENNIMFSDDLKDLIKEHQLDV